MGLKFTFFLYQDHQSNILPFDADMIYEIVSKFQELCFSNTFGNTSASWSWVL